MRWSDYVDTPPSTPDKSEQKAPVPVSKPEEDVSFTEPDTPANSPQSSPDHEAALPSVDDGFTVVARKGRESRAVRALNSGRAVHSAPRREAAVQAPRKVNILVFAGDVGRAVHSADLDYRGEVSGLRELQQFAEARKIDPFFGYFLDSKKVIYRKQSRDRMLCIEPPATPLAAALLALETSRSTAPTRWARP